MTGRVVGVASAAVAIVLASAAFVACDPDGCEHPQTIQDQMRCSDQPTVVQPGQLYPPYGQPLPGYNGSLGFNEGGTPSLGGYGAGGVPLSPGYSGSAPQSPAG